MSNLIKIDEENRRFKLDSGDTSYLIMVNDQDMLYHAYFGRKLPDGDYSYLIDTPPHSSIEAIDDRNGFWISDNAMRLEYPVFGRADKKETALEIKFPDGSNVITLAYKSYKVHEGTVGIKGLPAAYANEKSEAETLELVVADDSVSIEVHLFYTVWRDLSVICRHAEIVNNGKNSVVLKRALSAVLDLPERDYIMTTNCGAWASERRIERHELFSGVQGLYSKRGNSSHIHNPFVVLQRKTADENQGDVYGAVLAYSGSYEMLADVDAYGMTRLTMGINHDCFEWVLEAGETFATPEANLVFSHNGLNGMSQEFHKLYRDHMCRGKYKNERRPVLLNTWEGCYFNFNEDTIVNIAKSAADLGIELLVVDDGWFGHRNGDNSSLGDWYPNEEKLPSGVKGLAEKVHAEGLKFGIWFEPEMISRESDLYRAHPEWTLCAKGRPISQGRNQYLLDMSRKDVQDYLYDCIAKTINDGVDYIKWDYNRNFAEVGSQLLPPEKQGEVSHRFILGLYSLLERLNKDFPDVLFESCSGGGGRFDAGMLYYMPQTWASDDTDAIKRLEIQYGTSIVYPLSCMSAHISVCPNHQTGRTVSYKTRQDVAYTGSFGFELDPTKMSEEERNLSKATIQEYISYGDMFVNGTYYRIANPKDDGYAAWMFLSTDESEARVTYATIDHSIEGPVPRLRIPGLLPEATYVDEERGRTYTGAYLMYAGILADIPGDRGTVVYKLKRK